MKRYETHLIPEILQDSYVRERFSDAILSCGKKVADYEGLLFDPFNRQKEYLKRSLENLAESCEGEKSLYRQWPLKKENEKVRLITTPNEELDNLLRTFVLPLIKTQRVHSSCHGGEKGYDPLRSLSKHVPMGSALSFDLKKAHERIPIYLTYPVLVRALGRDEPDEDVDLLYTLCTIDYKDKEGLPVGSPVSNALFSRALYSIDEILTQKSKERELSYSRWVDDFIISSHQSRSSRPFLGAIDLVRFDLDISPSKTFFQRIIKGNMNSWIYLLGHKIRGKRIAKNSKEERDLYKGEPINFEDLSKLDYDSWNENF